MNEGNPGQPSANQPGGQWQYKPASTAASDQAGHKGTHAAHADRPLAEVTWTASEFVAHSKGIGWYGGLAVVAAAAMALVYFWTRDYISIAAVFIMALLLAVMAGRKPRILDYEINSSGFTMGRRFYPYADFKSFSVVDEDAFSSIVFMPLKRFMPPISIYYDPKDEERIVGVLSHYLPIQQYSHDAIEQLARRFRF